MPGKKKKTHSVNRVKFLSVKLINKKNLINSFVLTALYKTQCIDLRPVFHHAACSFVMT